MPTRSLTAGVRDRAIRSRTIVDQTPPAAAPVTGPIRRRRLAPEKPYTLPMLVEEGTPAWRLERR